MLSKRKKKKKKQSVMTNEERSNYISTATTTTTIAANNADDDERRNRSMLSASSASSTSENLKILLFYMLSVIVICLTAFNFYLFCWIWSSLRANNGDESGSILSNVNNNEWAKLDVISAWDSIRFNGKLSTKSTIQVNQLKALNIFNDDNKKEQQNYNDNSKQRTILSILPKKSAQFLSHNARAAGEKVLLEVGEDRISFPSGLIVKSLGRFGQNKQEFERKVLMVCEPTTTMTTTNDDESRKKNDEKKEKEANCLISSPNVKFSHLNGLNLGGKSIETRRLETKKVHSPTQALNFLTTQSAKFKSNSSQIELISLDDLWLFSRRSTVSKVKLLIFFSKIICLEFN